MALLLHIDTATEYGAVALSDNERIINVKENHYQKEHASFLHPAIDAIMKESGISFNEINAIAVTMGPGSYTGLRVGLTAAKGLCYVLKKPLIGVNTLEAMALTSIEDTNNINFSKPVLFAPMIDARRMEVYTGLYKRDGTEYNVMQAIMLDENTFVNEAVEYEIVVSGDGGKKLEKILKGDGFIFTEITHNIKSVITIAVKNFSNNKFENPAYCEPYYLKPFYTTAVVKK